MVCVNCGKGIPEEGLYCPHCGVKKDEVICDKCGKSVKAEFTFCNFCGSPLAEKAARKAIRNRPHRVRILGKWHLWLKLSLHTFFLLAILLFLFLPIGRINLMDIIPAGGMHSSGGEKLEIRYNIIDTMTVTCSYVFKDETEDDYATMVEKMIMDLEEISDADDFNDLTAREIREAERVIKRMFCYEARIPKFRETAKLSIAYMILLNVVVITVFVINLIFFIFSIINLAKGDPDAKPFKTSFWVLLLTIILFLTAHFYNKTSVYSLGSGPILVFIFGAAQFVALFIMECILGKYQIHPLFLIKKLISLGLIVIVFIFINSAGLKYKYEITQITYYIPRVYNVTDYESIHELGPHYNFLFSRTLDHFSDDTYYDTIQLALRLMDAEKAKTAVKYLVKSANAFSTNNMLEQSSTNIFLGLSSVLHIAITVLLFFAIKNSARDLFNNKEASIKSNNIFLSCALGLWIAVLVFLGIAFKRLDANLHTLYSFNHTVSIGFGFYFVLGIFALLIVGNNLLPKKASPVIQ